jgi:hypothetical protein
MNVCKILIENIRTFQNIKRSNLIYFSFNIIKISNIELTNNQFYIIKKIYI